MKLKNSCTFFQRGWNWPIFCVGRRLRIRKGNVIKNLISRTVQIIQRDILGITTLRERIDQLEELSPDLEKVNWERSRERWRLCKPSISLTWEKDLSGDNFISKVSSFDVFSHEKTVLEIGPGYGRLLKSCMEKKIPFRKYVGVDISAENVKYLQENFQMPTINIIHADVEKVSLEESFDVVLSSLTFKHLYPSFEKALSNVMNYVNPGSMFFFDLIEGNSRYFEKDNTTYIRWYNKSEILEILKCVNLELVTFDQVQHDQDYIRLLVVARKPSSPRI